MLPHFVFPCPERGSGEHCAAKGRRNPEISQSTSPNERSLYVAVDFIDLLASVLVVLYVIQSSFSLQSKFSSQLPMSQQNLVEWGTLLNALTRVPTDNPQLFDQGVQQMLHPVGAEKIVQSMAFVAGVMDQGVDLTVNCTEISNYLKTIIERVFVNHAPLKSFQLPKAISIFLDLQWTFQLVGALKGMNAMQQRDAIANFRAVFGALGSAVQAAKSAQQPVASIDQLYQVVSRACAWRLHQLGCAPISLAMLTRLQQDQRFAPINAALVALRKYVSVYKYGLLADATEQDVKDIDKTPRYFTFDDRLFSDTIFVALPPAYAASPFFNASLGNQERFDGLAAALTAIQRDLGLDASNCIYVQCHYTNPKIGSLTNRLVSLFEMQRAVEYFEAVAVQSRDQLPDHRLIRDLRSRMVAFRQNPPTAIDSFNGEQYYRTAEQYVERMRQIDGMGQSDALVVAWDAAKVLDARDGLIHDYNVTRDDVEKRVILEKLINETDVLAEALVDFRDSFADRAVLYAPQTYDMDATVRKNRRGVVSLNRDRQAYDYFGHSAATGMVLFRRTPVIRPASAAAVLAWIKSEGNARGINPFGRFGSYTPVGVYSEDGSARNVVQQAYTEWPDCRPGEDATHQHGLLYLLDAAPNPQTHIVVQLGKIAIAQATGTVADPRDRSPDTLNKSYPLPSPQQDILNPATIAKLLPDTKLLPQAWSFILSHISGRPRVDGDAAMGLYTSELIRLANNRSKIVPGYEWLHIIARSLAGLERPSNFLCGNYNANSWNIVWETIVTRYLSSGYHVIYAVQNTEAPVAKQSWLGWVPSADAREVQHILAIKSQVGTSEQIAHPLNQMTVSATALNYEESATRFPNPNGLPGDQVLARLRQGFGDNATYFRSIDIPFYIDARPSKWINAAIKVYLDLENIAEEADAPVEMDTTEVADE